MSSPHRTTRALVFAFAVCPLSVFAQVVPTTQAPVVPYRAFLGESIGIPIWNGSCPEPIFDASQVPQIEFLSFTPGIGSEQVVDEHTYKLVYRMGVPDLPACFMPPPPPPGFGQLIDIGDLPQGNHTILVQGITPDDEVYVEYEAHVYVSPVDTLREDVSGVWYAPEQNGRGVTVARANGTAVIYWATHDADGESAWTVLTKPWETGDAHNIVEGTALSTRGEPLAPGASDIEANDWGSVRFEYKGCGQARIEWDAIDSEIVDGGLDLVQVLRPDGVYNCDVQATSDTVEAEWVE